MQILVIGIMIDVGVVVIRVWVYKSFGILMPGQVAAMESQVLLTYIKKNCFDALETSHWSRLLFYEVDNGCC